MRSPRSCRLTLVLCGASLLSCLGMASATPALTLGVDGRPNAVIVLAAKPSAAARQGAEILADHLFEMGGGRFRTVQEGELGELEVKDGRLVWTAGKLPAGNLILVGESAPTRALGATAKGLGPGGVLIRTFPNALVLLGPDHATPSDPWGTRYAVTRFLERDLGCRYLWPGQDGKVVPKRRRIEVGPIHRTYTPVLRQRRIRSASYGERTQKGLDRLGATKEEYLRTYAKARVTRSRSAGWFGWHCLGGSLRLRSGHAFGHMWAKYGKEHPEWFAMQPNGSRDQSQAPGRCRLCVSNPKLIEAIAREKIEQLNRSDVKSVSIGPNDGGRSTFCTCKACEKLDASDGRKLKLIDFSPGANRRTFEHVSLTDRYVHFWNAIARRVVEVHPNAWLTADAYSVYAAPPVRAKLYPNIAIRFVGISYRSDTKRAQGLADWDQWAKATKKLYFRPNLLLFARRQGTPAVYVHKMAKDFRYLAGHSMIGTDFDSCMHHWSTQGLNYYVLARLHWNPDLDVDAVIDDYCRAGFGRGAEHVKRYLLRLEGLTDEIAANELTVTEPYTPKVTSELRGYLSQAARATRDDPAAQRRVAFLQRGLEYTEVRAAWGRLFREYNDAGQKLAPDLRERGRKVLDRNWLLSREILYNDPLAVNVACVAWGGWGYFGRLGWRGPSAEALRKASHGDPSGDRNGEPGDR